MRMPDRFLYHDYFYERILETKNIYEYVQTLYSQLMQEK